MDSSSHIIHYLLSWHLRYWWESRLSMVKDDKLIVWSWWRGLWRGGNPQPSRELCLVSSLTNLANPILPSLPTAPPISISWSYFLHLTFLMFCCYYEMSIDAPILVKHLKIASKFSKNIPLRMSSIIFHDGQVLVRGPNSPWLERTNSSLSCFSFKNVVGVKWKLCGGSSGDFQNFYACFLSLFPFFS